MSEKHSPYFSSQSTSSVGQDCALPAAEISLASLESSLASLENAGEFIPRHIGPQPADIGTMLKLLGLNSLDQLIDRAVPDSIRAEGNLQLPTSCSEQSALRRLQEMAKKNKVLTSMIGQGYSDTVTPSVILRNIFENPGWYTAYTPYQAEISQGRMEALLNFQTMITDLSGMEIANASLLDEATAAAEAMTLCRAVQKRHKGKAFFVVDTVHPQTLEVLQTRAEPMGIELVLGAAEDFPTDGSCYAALVQYPDTFGAVVDPTNFIEQVHAQSALVVVAADLLALTLLKAPGEMGADVVVGSAQRFGVPLGFGGPHAGYMGTRESYKRNMPGRLIGVSQDANGKPALRLALQTREQHIRREKATSNICTAQVLLAVMAGAYATYHGPEGLKRIARRAHRFAGFIAKGAVHCGFKLDRMQEAGAFFDTVSITVGKGKAEEYCAAARELKINLRKIDADTIGVACDEKTSREDVLNVLQVLSQGREQFDLEAWDHDAQLAIPECLRRSSEILSHPVFNSYQSETEMMRYLYRLQQKDLTLQTSMIPLGSCTMKLNAASEMVPVTWQEFGGMHPFAPSAQTVGYREMIRELEHMLAMITGFKGVSLQPNAGSQGEYAGLLVIRKYHESQGQGHRNICLIPSSAHGTNPASAAMAAMKVVVVKCDEAGNIDMDDLRAKAVQHQENLSTLMVTYPSTHGVFETSIIEICELVHKSGGQVYLDGANMNALVGICRPGEFGADVSHLNLHKTFAIPHGGGGPGVGPIGVAGHLVPFLPQHSQAEDAGPKTGISAVAAAPWGSGSILPISWMYIAMLGRDGLLQSTQVAILNANYIAKRLAEHYPLLYTGPGGMVAHECILDFRGFKQVEIEVEDIAKRLMDYGFHAPTMSWPVAGTLMIEPTESESKQELDRFCDAMIQIRKEIAQIESGGMSAADSPLKHAPHTVDDLAGEWQRSYSRQEGVFPLPWVQANKFWPAVNRVDNAYGDRNLQCMCPPMEAYE